MKRKNSTVNPKAGTLKQQDRALRINRQSGFVKSIAFALLLSLTAPAVTQAMGDLADTGRDLNTRVDRSTPDSCCVAEVRQQNGTFKVIRLTIPSREMLRKSDSEANRNMVYSLKENKLRRMQSWISRSDREIAEQFDSESRISLGQDLAKADADMTVYFQAENILAQMPVVTRKADEDMRDFFILENEGLAWSNNGRMAADEDISRQFVRENTRISMPSAAAIAKADAEMALKPGVQNATQAVVSSY